MTRDVTTRHTLVELGGETGPTLRLERIVDGPVSLVGIDPARPARSTARLPWQPLVEILAVGHGRISANVRHTATAIGARLRYTSHVVEPGRGWGTVHVDQHDPVTGLAVRTTLRGDRRGLEAWTTVRNDGPADVELQAVSSLMVCQPVGDRDLEDLDSVEGTSDWLGESRFTAVPLRGQRGLVSLGLQLHQRQDARGARAIVNRGTWSSGERVPSGVVAVRGGGPAAAWQVQHNGAWRVELAERLDSDDKGCLVLGLFGPTDADHGWSRVLAAGEEFVTVPVSVAWSADGLTGAVAEMTRHRRGLRRPREERPSVVFNDYMNTLMGDPTTEKLAPLIAAAAAVGAEYFCIDAGWYDDGGDWWDSVGLWEPSTTRFTGAGLTGLTEQIRAAGMVPGLWLEPEVVGVRSPLAERLPDAAFLHRGGVRIVEHGRYFLDLRQSDAVKHLDTVVDRLVDELGVGYLKLDYNVTPGPGTDVGADSLGDGLLQQNRAHLAWLDTIRERHPGLVIENCASGAMRADYALLSRLDLQSTSDQQDPLRYPPIAAGALMSILPEQAANWAYPQPDMDAEQIVFTMCTGLAGRLYLSGRLDGMDDAQLALVREGVGFARTRADHLQEASPCWPLGLPDWADPWVAAGLSTPTETLVAVWWRGEGPREAVLDLPDGSVEVAYPGGAAGDGWRITPGDGAKVRVRVTGDHPQARILRVTHPPRPDHPAGPQTGVTDDVGDREE